MPSITEIARLHGDAYLERFDQAVPRRHRQVLAAIAACRTRKLGTAIYACSSCARKHRIGRSCGNRHRSTCQQGKTKAWLLRQHERLLPCPCFLITFTLPAEMRPFVPRHQRLCFGALLMTDCRFGCANCNP